MYTFYLHVYVVLCCYFWVIFMAFGLTIYCTELTRWEGFDRTIAFPWVSIVSLCETVAAHTVNTGIFFSQRICNQKLDFLYTERMFLKHHVEHICNGSSCLVYELARFAWPSATTILVLLLQGFMLLMNKVGWWCSWLIPCKPSSLSVCMGYLVGPGTMHSRRPLPHSSHWLSCHKRNA